MPHDGRNLPQEKKRAIVQSLQEGATVRDVAKTHQVSSKTAIALQRASVTTTGLPAGEWTTWKNDLSGEFESITKIQARQYRQALEQGEIQAKDLPVHMGILVDKVLLLRSESAASIGPSEPSVADVLGELRGLAGPGSTVNVQVNIGPK